MSYTGVGCELRLDGAPVDGGCWDVTPPGGLEGLSVAEGLHLTWGRKTSIEQPASSSCTFRLWDDPGGATYGTAVKIGTAVEVWATGKVSSGGDDRPAFEDGQFEQGVRAVSSTTAVTRSTRAGRVGPAGFAAQLHPLSMAAPWSVQLPPAELQTAGTNPGAWDDLQRIGPGETWRVQLQLWVPEAIAVRVRPLIYTGPYAAAGVAQPTLVQATGPGWVTVDQPYYPGAVNGWLGLQLDVGGGLTWEQLPASLRWATEPPTVLWEDYSDVFVGSVTLLGPPEGSDIEILVFGGRVTDLQAVWDDQLQGAGVDVTAVDFLGDLGNRYVGDSPWSAEPLQTRFLRVLQLAAAAGEPATVAEIATTLAPRIMTYEDVDHRAAAGLLTDMANSVDGVLWSATHAVAGPYVKLEDPAQRAPLYRLQLVDGVVDIVTIDPETLPVDLRPTELSACDVLRDPVTFARNVSDIATRVSVSWQLQTTGDDGNPATEDRTFTVIDDSREIDYGTRAVSLQSMLTTELAASGVADRLLARQLGQWRMEGLAVADEDFRVPDAAAATILLTLLDGVRRGGLPLLVTDMPSWSPLGETIPCYLEGGEYTFSGGGWTLALAVSRATGLGANAAWNDLAPTWQWDMWNPTMTWDQLRGVAGPA